MNAAISHFQKCHTDKNPSPSYKSPESRTLGHLREPWYYIVVLSKLLRLDYFAPHKRDSDKKGGQAFVILYVVLLLHIIH